MRKLQNAMLCPECRDHYQTSRAKGQSRVEIVKGVTARKNPEKGIIILGDLPGQKLKATCALCTVFLLSVLLLMLSALAKSGWPGAKERGYALEGRELRGRADGTPAPSLFTFQSPILQSTFKV